MIQTVADLLQALMEKEREKLPEFKDIQHTGIFGEMYEGLTKALIGKALFENMDLRVMSGKIVNSKRKLSNQIDCMVVIGAGEEIPYTQEFKYPVEKVVMIVEVKKTLYGADLKDAFELFQQFVFEVAEPVAVPVSLLNDIWRALFKKNLPSREQAKGLPFHEEMIYHTLVSEATTPLKVVFGYEGYVDEFGLRQGLVDYFRDVEALDPKKRPRLNINSFPNLVVCRKASLVKLDGMPYTGMMDANGYWWWIASRGAEPFHSLLELLWTRLSVIFKISPEIFGEDLEMESLNPLLAGKAEPIGDRGGWKYEEMFIAWKRR